MSVRKKKKNLAGLPSETTAEERDVITRLTAEHKGYVQACLDIMSHIAVSKRAEAEANNIQLDRVRVMDASQEALTDEQVAERLALVAHISRRMEVAKVMSEFLSSVGCASTRKGKYVLSVPIMAPEDIRPFLREPLAEGETACAAGVLCYARKVPGWPAGRNLRSLVLDGETRYPGHCVVCHDFLVYEFILKQDQEDPHRRFAPDPANTGATQTQGHPVVVNDIQYLFGHGGYKPSIRMTQMDLKPINGVIGQMRTPSLTHYAAFEEEGIWWLTDASCHFPTPSA